ncbi:PadR family transcriptional regulator [Ktedonosporobacter rubrisoli]|uniref:PadR family transcriptional regulator n=1 Tax=Ktedonosporobacter rubrisoli TaxID=2509675 RepID=A0A4P6JNR3_KTERU|nr:PadR family transcriptional regulator [Ktedonosporobacter rubrisoli]QBD76959.1 PadR family transcriptional regulator [Ktedonosporobacter rubrisoli]
MGKENKSKYALLGMLSLLPMSGYDLKKAIEGGLGHFWQENYAQIYPMLKQLQAEGLTISHSEKQEGKPERRIYALTDKGREELRRWLAGPVEHQVIRNELLLKLFFGTQVPLPASIEHVREYREKYIQLLQIFEQTEVQIKQEYATNPNLPYWLLTLSNGKYDAQAVIAWCDEALVTLENLAEPEAREKESS